MIVGAAAGAFAIAASELGFDAKAVKVAVLAAGVADGTTEDTKSTKEKNHLFLVLFPLVPTQLPPNNESPGVTLQCMLMEPAFDQQGQQRKTGDIPQHNISANVQPQHVDHSHTNGRIQLIGGDGDDPALCW